MDEEMFVQVYQVNLEFCYLHILIVVFPCGFKDFYGIYRLRKKKGILFKVDCKKYIIHNYVLYFFHLL
jgi:hypothetical protein